MRRKLFLFFGSAFLTAALPWTASAQECANGVCANGACANGVCANGTCADGNCAGGNGPVYGPQYSNGGACARGRKKAILTPVEAFGVHPPGLDPYDANRCWILHRWRHLFIPYYAPLSPTSTSARFKPWCYFPLMPYYTPYYIGYCPHRLCDPKPPPYGWDGGWGPGPRPAPPCDGPNAPKYNSFGAYTSILKDDTIFWNMGGNGLVPYGAPRPPHLGPPDLVDAIQSTRAQAYGFGGGACGGGVAGAAPPAVLPGPATAPPMETAPKPSALPPSEKNLEAGRQNG